MKYVKTIDMWADGVQEAIRSGKLTMQRGQYVRCGENNKPARYVGVTDRGIFYVAHDQGCPKKNAERFKDLCVAFNQQ